MKFNVHWWDGQNWRFLFTVICEDEKEAVAIAEFRCGTEYPYKAYPHIDNFPEVK